MPIDQGRDPWSGTTYRGFAGGPAGHPPEPPHRHAPRPAWLAAGVAAAVVLGVGFGFLARPELARAPAGAKVPTAQGQSAQLAPPQAPVPITIGKPPPAAAIPQPQGKLETLPPEMAAAARQPVRPHEAAQASAEASAIAPQTTPVLPSVQPPSPSSAPPAEAAAPQARPQLRASFDCSAARAGAEQMVCGDPELAAADRQMASAYRRALRAGADPFDLRQEQRDWVVIREDAARHSRRALAQVYDQRIQELDQIADLPPADDAGE